MAAMIPAAAAASAIEVRGVRKEYDLFASPAQRFLSLLLRTRRDAERFVALDSVDLEVGRGETIGILGRNGAGKSTLLQLIAGVLTPTSGQVAVRGRVAAMLELGAGFHPDYTGRENIRLAASLYGVPRDEIEARFEEIAAFADIGQHIDLPMRTYSSGMYVRLAFAVHTAIDPDVLIIDEALAVGDAAFQAKCYRRLRELKDKGTSILLVSHDVQSIRLFCDRAVWLDRGRVRLEGKPEQVTALYLQELHGGQPVEATATVPALPATPSPSALGNAFAQDCDLSDGGTPPGAHRWGRGGGRLLSAEILSPGGTNPGAAVHGEALRIVVTFRLDPSANSPGVGAAFAIRHRKSLDLVCESTAARHIALPARGGDEPIRVEFDFDNILAPDEYSLAVALEHNVDGHPEYLDFVEGILGFSVVSSEYIYSLVRPSVRITTY
jgi:lipopolysaccharide transport system ATP-binding protein